MDRKRASLFLKGYSFAVRNILAGMVVNKALDLLAWSDYRLLILLSMWHPDMNHRIKYLRKRGVQIGENVFIDMGVFIEVTTPQSVIIEDQVAIGYGATIYAHDASLNCIYDLPLRVKTTRLCYNCTVGTGAIIMPGVTVGRHGGVFPGSVALRDVPELTGWGGHPAKHVLTGEDIVKSWQEDMKANPDNYYDHPHPDTAADHPLKHLITWREEGVKIRDVSDLRTGTPFDYILEYKELKKKDKEESKEESKEEG
jgi:maltose O-acetyltransferase